MTRTSLRLTLTTGVIGLLAACEGGLPDFDLRDLGNGFDTSQAVANLPDRPQPDNRGVISYPTYQVVVAQSGDTVTTVATRLGLNTGELARFNGIAPDDALRAGELIALPSRVAEPSPATGATTTGPLDVATIATTALDRADAQTQGRPSPTASATAQATTARPLGAEPVRHRVKRGETVFSIARLYDVPVSNIAEWNGLGSDLTIREGSFVLVPQGSGPAPSAAAPSPVPEPGVGTPTPVPPSSTTPLPDETPPVASAPSAAPAAPDIGTPTAPAPAADTAVLASPVNGNIIRAYAAGRNEGIDIGVPAGTSVKAADAGTVAAVTTDTNAVAIVVIKHAGNLLTVYTNIEDLSVAKGANVSRGQTIGKVREGSPSFLHFETRRGLQSVDPTTLLP